MVCLAFCLKATAQQNNNLVVTINWSPSVSTNVAAYKIYYGNSSGHYTNTITVGADFTSWQISGLSAASTYFAAIKSVNPAGIESAFSPEVYFTTPTPPTLVITPWTDPYGNTFVRVTTKQVIQRYWELDYSYDLEEWTPYEYGYNSQVDEPNFYTGWDPLMYFRVVIH